jgi:hypothetical protein
MLCVSGVEAKGFTTSNVSGRSGFSRGFSPSKSSGSNVGKGTTAPKSVFGSFGNGAKSAPAPAAPEAPADKSSRSGIFSSNAPAGVPPLAPNGKSALSAGLEKNAAQDNALKTFDQRTGKSSGTSSGTAGNATPGTDFGNSSTIAGQRTGGPAYMPPLQPQPAHVPTQTVVVHDSGSSWGNNLMWFMLGRSLSEHRHYDAPYVGGSSGNGNGSAFQPGPQGGDIAAPQESFGWSVLRIFLWLALVSAIGWTIWFYVRRKNRQATRRHYTL